ncbi:MAG: HypC/HybG/HupF family hydrogenase formation chaperone [Planctomycetota bacterium]|nr:MAG: HypC/HybG/HupF family hydrogenase formation chaperone [Planctomycetota bacterium]
MCLAVPGKIISVQDDGDDLARRGKVDFGGVLRDVSLACVPEARVGEYVLVHVGMAISTIDPREAERVFDALEQLGEIDEATGESS